MYLSKEGTPLAIFDEKSRKRAVTELGVNKVGPALYLFDENGETRDALFVFEYEHGLGLNLRDEDGNVVWRAPACLVALRQRPRQRLYLQHPDGSTSLID
jgi:hypothetical protein